MTLLDDRPMTGLTTQYSSAGPFGWPHTLSLTPSEPKTAAPRPRALKLAIVGTGPQSPPPYIRDIEQKINRLLDLPAGWDRRRAACTTDRAVEATVAVLLGLMTPHSPPVQLFPLPDGGIQAEWHLAGNSIEIEIDAEGEPFVSAETSGGAPVAEGDLDVASQGGLMADTRRFLARLSRAAVAR
jgi:hypothetical protein